MPSEKEILQRLKSLGSKENREGMQRFGINVEKAYGVPVVEIRKLAKEIGRDHSLGEKLWSTGNHEARILSTIISNPDKVSEQQMERWVKVVDSWDLCDQMCSNLFSRSRYAKQKALEWSKRPEEFVKRAGFSLMASLAVHNKKAKNDLFLSFLPAILRESTDDRNFVKKAVNWALRQIGKRNLQLNVAAIKTATEMQTLNSKSAKWIASDALRELTSDEVQERLK